MKNSIKYHLLALLLFVVVTGCDEYLDQTPDAMVSTEEIFGNYKSVQGYLDKQYPFIWDAACYAASAYPGFGDEFLGSNSGQSDGQMARGNYKNVTASANKTSRYMQNDQKYKGFNPGPEEEKLTGIWPTGWKLIRDANLVLKHLNLMKDATDEERNLIEGQAYFFRAYHYYSIVIHYGGMPYLEKFIEGGDNPNIPRLNTWETIEKIAADLDKAASLLPKDWNDTEVGREAIDKNIGRITKGACIGLKSKILLFAGSPTFVLESTGILDYDAAHLKRSAEAALQVINLGVYSLVPWSDYLKQFARNDGFNPWSSETILACVNYQKGKWDGFGEGAFQMMMGRTLTPKRFGGTISTQCVTQNMVAMYETINGLPIDDEASGFEPLDPWSNRDPRFRATVIVDKDEWTFANPEENRFEVYKGGRDNVSEFTCPFICKKYWPKGVNIFDLQWDKYTLSSPNLRLAEVYLIYAEAVNEIYGPTGKIGDGPTAEEAVNIVRDRVGMPPVNAKFLTSKEEFRERIWNERAVEFLGEDGTRYMDLRRWHVADQDKYKIIYGLEFDEGHTYFNIVTKMKKVFDEKHYWMPIRDSDVQMYPEFLQNPGW